MAHTNISTISWRYNNDFATMVLTQAARARSIDVSLSGQGGLLMCVCVLVSVHAAMLAQALQTCTAHAEYVCPPFAQCVSILTDAYITFQTWSSVFQFY